MDFYTELTSLPVPQSAQFQISKCEYRKHSQRHVSRQPNPVLRLKSTIQDPASKVKRNVVRSIHLSSSPLLSTYSESNEVLSSFSPTGSYLAVLRSTPDPDAPSSTKHYVEIWAGDTLKLVHDVTSVHGAFLSSGNLLLSAPSSLTWVL
jgi:hypothetical protein